jgi:hypothetical protein
MARGGARPGAGRPARKSANTSPPSARARARARVGSENQRAVAGRQGRALGDRPADPVCEKRTDPHNQLAITGSGWDRRAIWLLGATVTCPKCRKTSPLERAIKR